MEKKVKINSETIRIDSCNFFLRLVAAAQREENLESYFEYELAAEPTCLFKNGMLRKAVKSELKNIIKDTYAIQNIPKDTNFAIDGGALLYQIKWGEKIKHLKKLLNSIIIV